MRTVLFVQTDGGSLKRVHETPNYFDAADVADWVRDFVAFMVVNAQGETQPWWRRHRQYAHRATRWWIVQCDTADDARRCITNYVDTCGLVTGSGPALVIASGGRGKTATEC